MWDDDEMEGHLEQFLADLKASGYELAEREPDEEEERSELLVDMWRAGMAEKSSGEDTR